MPRAIHASEQRHLSAQQPQLQLLTVRSSFFPFGFVSCVRVIASRCVCFVFTCRDFLCVCMIVAIRVSHHRVRQNIHLRIPWAFAVFACEKKTRRGKVKFSRVHRSKRPTSDDRRLSTNDENVCQCASEFCVRERVEYLFAHLCDASQRSFSRILCSSVCVCVFGCPIIHLLHNRRLPCAGSGGDDDDDEDHQHRSGIVYVSTLLARPASRFGSA